MALTTYSDVVESLRRYLWDREDLQAQIADAIVLNEARLNNQLRVAQMETSATVTLTSGSGSLPTDYLAWRRVLTQDNPVRQLEWAEPDWAEEHYYALTAAAPSCHFTIIGSTIKTYPTSSSDLTLLYYQKIPPLASNTSGNWITSRHPGLYIYGTLVELAPFLDDDDRIQTWAGMLKEAMDSLRSADVSARYNKSTMRVPGATP